MSDRAVRTGVLLPTRGILFGGEDVPPVERVVALAKRAEAAGCDSVWVGDSLVAKPRLEPLATLSAVAARTSRVRLGTAVMLGALRQPVLLAQTAATVDLLSGGRLTLGMGVGGAFTPEQRQEWDAAGVAQRGRAHRLEEVVEVARRLWSGESVDFKGEHFTLDGVALGFRPRQRPGVPVLLACHAGNARDAQCGRAARLADGMIAISDSPEAFGEVRRRLLREAEALGRNPRELRAVFYMTANLNDDPQAAFADADRWIKQYYGLNFWAERWGPFGPPDAVVKRAKEYVAAGADELVFRFASYDVERQMDTFIRKVLPALR